jgi:hypothetical protein
MRLTVSGQDLGQRFSVPKLLVDPQAEEGRHIRIGMSRRQEEISQVTNRVVLNIVHVTEAAQGRGAEGVVVERR